MTVAKGHWLGMLDPFGVFHSGHSITLAFVGVGTKSEPGSKCKASNQTCHMMNVVTRVPRCEGPMPSWNQVAFAVEAHFRRTACEICPW